MAQTRTQAERQVFEGRELIARQMRIIARLRERGDDDADSLRTLQWLERSLRMYEDDLKRAIDRETRPASPPPAPPLRQPLPARLPWRLRSSRPPA